MEVGDIELRNVTYQLFVEHGRAPSADAVAAATGATVEEVQRGWRRLHDALAHAWWGDRLAPDWRPHSPEQNRRSSTRSG